MKVTIAKDGETKEFECEGLVLVVQNEDDTEQIVVGRLNAPGWAAILDGLSDVTTTVRSEYPGAAILFDSVNKETDHDES